MTRKKKAPEFPTRVLMDLLTQTKFARNVKSAQLRNAAAQLRMADLALKAANHVWPGFKGVMDALLVQEAELEAEEYSDEMAKNPVIRA